MNSIYISYTASCKEFKNLKFKVLREVRWLR